jgi:hypothetical protein
MLEVVVLLEAWLALGLKSKAKVKSVPNQIYKLC